MKLTDLLRSAQQSLREARVQGPADRDNFDIGAWTVPAEVVGDELETSEIGRIYRDHEGHQIHKVTSYLSAYDEQFGPLRSSRNVRILEIGVDRGGSLQLWRKYFGPDAVVFGIDVNEDCARLSGDFEVRIGSQADPEFLLDVVAEMGGVDIVLDDGGHIQDHMYSSFRTLFPVVNEGGIYAVEDLQTSYWRDFGGGYERPGTFVEVVKDLIDDMQGWSHERADKVSGVDARRSIRRMAFYDSVVFIQKATRGQPTITRVGTPAF